MSSRHIHSAKQLCIAANGKMLFFVGSHAILITLKFFKMNFTHKILKSIIAFCLIILLSGCTDNSKTTSESEKSMVNEVTGKKWTNEQEEVIAAVEKILLAAGNSNIEVLNEMTSDNAIIGYSYLKDGVWLNNEMTISEYIESIIANNNRRPFSEIPADYDIIITEDRLALVRADAILSRFGIPLNREINHLTLMKADEGWKLLSIAWTVKRLPEEKRTFNLELFAHSYAQAWGSKRPGFVAMFFENNGTLQVNDGEPAKGRDAISDVAKGFMTDLPDMIVQFDSLVPKSNGAEFHWTLIATNTGPGGTGNKVKVSGFELWKMSENGLIKESRGYFPSEEFDRQLKFGVGIE